MICHISNKTATTFRAATDDLRTRISGLFGSLAYLHNETINIYSHLIPSLLSLPWPRSCMSSCGRDMSERRKAMPLPFSCFFLGEALCLGTCDLPHHLKSFLKGQSNPKPARLCRHRSPEVSFRLSTMGSGVNLHCRRNIGQWSED